MRLPSPRAEGLTRFLVPLLPFALAGALLFLRPAAASAQADGKIWSGAYSTVQAIRGKVNFSGSCERCHGANLAGVTAPSLSGTRFMSTWENESVYKLFVKVRDTMPPNFGTALTDEAKLDVVAYLLQANGFPAGDAELKMDSAELESLQIVRKGQGNAGPNFSFVQAVGCLTPGPGNAWTLTRATEPTLTRDQPSTADDLRSAGAAPLGTLSFHLVSVSAFKPDSIRGRKVEAKGLVYRDGGDNRINLTSLQPAGPCP
jgi:quinoprotein glucose dehydrogenase